MSYHIHITSVAQRDLINAADHLEYVLKNPKAADDLLKEAEKQIRIMQKFDYPEGFIVFDMINERTVPGEFYFDVIAR